MACKVCEDLLPGQYCFIHYSKPDLSISVRHAGDQISPTEVTAALGGFSRLRIGEWYTITTVDGKVSTLCPVVKAGPLCRFLDQSGKERNLHNLEIRYAEPASTG